MGDRTATTLGALLLVLAPCGLVGCGSLLMGTSVLFTGEEGTTLSLPTEGSNVPTRVPLDVAWEVYLEIRPHDGSAPRIPLRSSARCLDPTICSAVIKPENADAPYPRLAVFGHRPGSSDLQIDYVAPGSPATKRKALLHFVFERAVPATPLRLGDQEPQGPALFEEVPSKLAHLGLKPPFRCEAENAVRSRYVCFARESYEGHWRYPSCLTSARCTSFDHQTAASSFDLTVSSHYGRVTSITAWLRGHVDGIEDQTAPIQRWKEEP